ncbi:MAG TPA: hypothetical protein VMT32_12430 [Bryobacteraceae bacterium]|nr:hypothetical protein [Bryobacteraceae bacterium]
MRAVSWLAAASGILLGFSYLVLMGQRPIPSVDSPGWVRELVGWGLFGAVFLVGSLVALRHPRRAGIAFLAYMPFIAFCCAYPEAVFWESDPHGNFMRWPDLPTALFLAILFFLPFYAALFTIRHKALSASLFVVSALVAGLVFRACEWSRVLLPSLAAWSAPFLVCGAFWLGTSKLGWPPLIAPRKTTLWRRLAIVSAGCVLVGAMDVAATLTWAAARSRFRVFDCSGRPLFIRPWRPDHAVFTARLIYVHHGERVSGRRQGLWAIGLVQERFWGLFWSERVVLLTHNIFRENETSFIDGFRYQGLLTRCLPMVFLAPCARARPVADAAIQLRLLREAPPDDALLIIGYVRKPPEDDVTPLAAREPLPGRGSL